MIIDLVAGGTLISTTSNIKQSWTQAKFSSFAKIPAKFILSLFSLLKIAQFAISQKEHF